MDRFDKVERQFGISATCSSHEGFAALVKARYSDFVVHEIDRNGNFACLDSVEILQAGPTNEPTAEILSPSGGNQETEQSPADGNVDEAKQLKRKLSDVEEDSLLKKNKPDGETAPPPEVDWDSCEQELSKLVNDETSKAVVLFLKSVEVGTNQEKKFFSLPAIADKQIRRSIHMLVKSPLLNKVALADNHEGRIRIWHSMFKTSIPADNFGPRKGGNRRGDKNTPPWPADRPDFLRFVVYKENIDTGTAAKDIVRMAHLNPKRGISYAGMKDKRGVTSQFCSAYRATKEQMLAVNRSLAGPKHGGGNTSTRGASVIKLGNFTYSSEEVRLGQLKGNRFDVVLRNIDIGVADDIEGDAKTKLVNERLEAAGKALRERGFVNYFGMQRFGKFRDTHEVGICILKGDHEGAVDVIMREKGSDSNEYQNTAVARTKWAQRFAGVDLTNEEAAKDAEMKVAKDVVRSLGRFMVCEKSIVSSLSRKPRDYKRAFGSVSKQMRSMFLHAYQSYIWNKVASMRIETGGYSVQVGDLVLTGDKSSGTSGLKGKSVKILTADDVQNYNITDVVLPLAGSKIVYPEGLSGDLFVELMKEDGINREMFAKVGAVDKELALGGDYRKLICKPSDVTFEIKQYTDPVQPLLETDLMKTTGEKVAPVALEKASESPEANLYGMVVGFSLPPSSYATIALRELTKRPTSSEYQSMLELTGNPERNLM